MPAEGGFQRITGPRVNNRVADNTRQLAEMCEKSGRQVDLPALAGVVSLPREVILQIMHSDIDYSE